MAKELLCLYGVHIKTIFHMPSSKAVTPRERQSQLSKEIIELSEEEEEEEDGTVELEDPVESEHEHDDAESVDSHEDIEDIQPRKKDRIPRDSRGHINASGSRAPRLP